MRRWGAVVAVGACALLVFVTAVVLSRSSLGTAAPPPVVLLAEDTPGGAPTQSPTPSRGPADTPARPTQHQQQPPPQPLVQHERQQQRGWVNLAARSGGAGEGEGEGEVYMYDCGRTDAQPEPPPLPAGSRTEYVAIVVRHGDRVPYDVPCWPNYTTKWECNLSVVEHPIISSTNDKLHNPSVPRTYRTHFMEDRNLIPGNCEHAQLTDIGHMQQQQLGTAMRNFYITQRGFLPLTPSEGDVFVRYDTDSRTKQTALAFYGGLYPSLPPGKPVTSLLNVFTMDRTYDDLSPNSNICPCVGILQDYARASPEWQEHYQTVYLPLQTQIEAILGAPIVLENIHDCCVCMQCHNMTLPEGITKELLQQVSDCLLWQEVYLWAYPDPVTNGRLSMGFLLSEIFQQMQDRKEGSSNTKLAFFSAHDSSMESLMSLLGVWDNKWVPYASYQLFEVFTYQGEYNVRYAYNGQAILLPGCKNTTSMACSWAEFTALMEQYTPSDPATECASTTCEIYQKPL
ncbi:counting factor 60 [Pelomyxa schiedti]|nr:counting factor 60 [Pelomyxa schiedti]